MEGLLPLIVMIVLSIVLGSRKKKKPQYPTEEQHDSDPTTASESPWDDLMRELRKAQDPGRTPEEIYGLPDQEEEEEVFETPQPVFSMEPQPEPAPAPTPYFSYDDEEDEPEEMIFSYENYEDHISSETVRAAAVSSIVMPEEELDLQEDPADEDGQNVFPDGFDPRMAVLYSEVFRPKYVEN